MREALDQWTFVIAAYAVTIGGDAGAGRRGAGWRCARPSGAATRGAGK